MDLFLIYFASFLILIIISYLKSFFKEENLYRDFNDRFISYETFDKMINDQKENNQVKEKLKNRKVIFRTAKWKFKNIPQYIHKFIMSNCKKSTGYLTVYFSDEDILTFIRNNYEEFLLDYMSIIPGAYKADLFRLLVLHKYGGVYSDISQLYITDMNFILDGNEDIVIVRDIGGKGIFNSFIYCKSSQNPLITNMIEYVVENIRKRKYGEDCLDVTGPKALIKSYNISIGNDKIDQNIDTKGTFFDKTNNQKIKILSHTVYNQDSENKGFIEYKNNKLILARFPNYYKVMYDNENTKRYGELWKSRNVFL